MYTVELTQQFKDGLKQVYGVSDFGEKSYFFGVEVEQKKVSISVYLSWYKLTGINWLLYSL